MKLQLVTLISTLGLVSFTHATDLYVTTIKDSVSGSLREAIEASSPNDCIYFSEGMKGTIQLEKPLPMIQHDLAIYGPASGISISGCNRHQVFFVDHGHLVLDHVNVERGLSFGGHGGDSCSGNGGGAMGAGGALFVNEGAAVHCKFCNFTQNEAKGGYGGNTMLGHSVSSGGGGGGGFNGGHGGKGGVDHGTGNGGGGGGGFATLGLNGALDGGHGGGQFCLGGLGSKLLGNNGLKGQSGLVFYGAGGGGGRSDRR